MTAPPHPSSASLRNRQFGVSGPFYCNECRGVNSQLPVIQSHGMGVESAAITLKWLTDASSRDFCLCQLIVVAAQTGDEHTNDTQVLMERHLLPLLRKRRVRFVEVARAGAVEADGIVVLQDTRSPERLHVDGGFRLSEELLLNGTVPAVGSVHTCALKSKSAPIEAWLREYLRVPFRQAFGYNSEEPGRAQRSADADAKRNESAATVRVAFGFNVEEEKRGKRALTFDHQVAMAFGYNATEPERARRTSAYDAVLRRESFFPLIEWEWTREMAAQFIEETVGASWAKSACYFCPFNAELSKGTEKGLARLREHPEKAAQALLIERVSVAMNPRATLFARHSLHSILRRAADFAGVFEVYEQRLAEMSWSAYRVRRIYSKKGKADRCVEVIETGSHDEITARFARYLARANKATRIHNIDYAYIMERGLDYPAFEEYFVSAPATVKTKARYGVPWFDSKWDLLLHQQRLVST